jgi:hypothetical protein
MPALSDVETPMSEPYRGLPKSWPNSILQRGNCHAAFSPTNKLGKERAILLVREQRKLVYRSGCRIRNKRSRVSLARPSYLRNVLHEIPGEPVLHVADFRAAHRVVPANVPRNFSVHFRPIQQRIDHVVIVLDINVTCLERRLSRREVHCDCVLGNWDRPEQPAFGRPRIEIVNLLTRRVKDVKSYERECAMVIAPISADEFSEHEAHVGFEVKVLRGFACGGVGTGTTDSRPSDETIEVRNCGRLGSGSRQENVKQRARWPEQLQTAGNRKRCCRRRAIAAVSFDDGARQFRNEPGRCEHA